MEAIDLLLTRYSAAKLGTPPPSKEAVEALLEAAAHAPDHGRLRPWRLILIEGDARRALGEILAESLARRNPAAGDQALAREREKALRAPLIVVVATRCNRSAKIPVVEQIIAAGCAAHGLMLAAFAQGLGAFWRTGEAAYDEGVNEDFHTRGRRVSEQIAVMRNLWTEPLVNFEGSYHHLDRASINPLPVQRPIPVWMGGMAEPVLRRVAEISDGWFPQFQPGDEASHTLDRMRAYMKEAGRPVSAVGIEGRFTYGIGGPTEWANRAREWRDLGATHLSVNTMGAGLTARGHIEAILKMKPVLDGV